MRGRPNLYTSYSSETGIFPTWTQKVIFALFSAVLVLLPFNLPIINQLPFVRFLGDGDWIRLTTQAVIFAIAALGLNLLTGVAGQISLGHAFFMGAGAYASVYLGGQSGSNSWGHGLPMWIWLPGAGVAAALIGMLIAPAAVRVRGLYLGIVTVGLVFIGIHLSRVLPEISGQAEVGRNFPGLELRWWKEEEPFISFTDDGRWFGVDMSGNQKTYLFCLAALGLAALVSKNLIRSRTGRALQAIRDRDVAAEVMGVPEVKYKVMAFAISSFYAGVAGALFASFVGRLPPEFWDLVLSVEFIAILLIGGAGTTAGTLLGAFFVVLLPRLMEDFGGWMGAQAAGESAWASFWDIFVTTGGQGDSGLISTAQIAPGFPLPVSALDTLLYGALVIVFLLFEPLGLYGIWIKIRNYWKGWPFTY
jgi:branched-chain amino acid transport system permease protein